MMIMDPCNLWGDVGGDLSFASRPFCQGCVSERLCGMRILTQGR